MEINPRLAWICSSPRQDLSAHCRRKVQYPIPSRKDSSISLGTGHTLCKSWAEALPWFLRAFCSWEELSDTLVGVLYMNTSEREWSSSGFSLKTLYFVSLFSPDQKERVVEEKSFYVRQSPEASCMHQASATLSDLIVRAVASDRVTALTGRKLGLQLGANVLQTAVVHLNGEISWISFCRVSHLARIIVEQLPMLGIASAQEGSPGEFCWQSLLHCLIALYSLSLKTCGLQLPIIRQTISF